MAHVSGATPLAALDPHARRFGLHPLQTFTRARGPEQIDGAWGAITAETDERSGARDLACGASGPSPVRDRRRRSGALSRRRGHRVELSRDALPLGRRNCWPPPARPPAALVPLMQRTIENGFELTGPIARGDRATVDAHLEAIARHAPELEPMYRALAALTTRMKILRTVAEVRQALERPRIAGIVGLVPTMGALHAGHVALIEAARRECDTVVASVFVNPTQFGDRADLDAYPRDEANDARIAAEAGVDYLFAPAPDEIYPPGDATRVEIEGAALGLEGEFRPGHFRGVATVCLKLFLIVAPRLAFFGQKDAQQVAVVTQMVHDLKVDLQIRVVPTVRDPDGLALSSRNARLSAEERARALRDSASARRGARRGARRTRPGGGGAGRCSAASTSTTWRSRTSMAIPRSRLLRAPDARASSTT